MAIDVNSVTWHRFYNELPANKSIDKCRSHGADHAAYGWSPQIDPRWSDAQKSAYAAGYESR